MAKSAKKKFTVDDAAQEVVSAFEKFLQVLAVQSGGESPVEDDDDVEEADEDDEEVELDVLDREEVESLGIKELRELAAEYLGDDAPKKKADILEALEEFYDDEDEDEDEDDEEVEEVEDEDEDEDEDEEGEYDREELEELDLKELRKIARDEGHTAADYKGMDQEALIDLIMGEEDEEDADDEEDDEDEEEVEELDEDALKAMTQKDLLTLAKELEVKIPAAMKKQSAANKKKIIEKILDSGEEE